MVTDENRIFTLSIKEDGSHLGDIVVTRYRVPGRPIVKIKDFEVDPGQACIWLLAERESEDKSLKTKDCTYLAKITDQNGSPQVMLDERNIYPDLSNAVVEFVQQEGDTLVWEEEEFSPTTWSFTHGGKGVRGACVFVPQDKGW